MKIKPVNIKELRNFNITFSSFEEMFDYCYDYLKQHDPRQDDIIFEFKVLDTNEIFYIHGTPNGEDSVLYDEITFDWGE